jgi:general secretion pathway protein A
MTETFYGGFYGLHGAPFHITPDPAMLVGTDTHREALGAVEYGIAAGKGFIVVSGEVGVGKTTVLRAYLDTLDPATTRTIYLFNANLTIAELYREILDGLGGQAPASTDATGLLHLLQLALLEICGKGVRVILVVDEAQNMPDATLEALRILSNLETSTSKLLQILLVGQPELEATLAKHQLRQLRQRVAVRARIKPLTPRQCRRYVRARLQAAGWTGRRPLFTYPALCYLARLSRGIPRTLNICCDNALINGYGEGKRRIGLRLARQATRPLDLDPPSRVRVSFVVGGWVPLALVCFFALPGNLLSSGTSSDAAPPPVAQLERIDAPAPLAAQPTLPAPIIIETIAARPAPPPADPPAVATLAPPLASPPRPVAKPALAAAASPAAPAAERQWVVAKGDTLQKACRETYGSCSQATMESIYASNPQLGGKSRLMPGDVIKLPPRPAN